MTLHLQLPRAGIQFSPKNPHTIDGYHDAKACGDQADQNNSLSAWLNEGEIRIILRWPKTNPVTAQDLDSHLQIPYLTPRVAGTECDGDS